MMIIIKSNNYFISACLIVLLIVHPSTAVAGASQSHKSIYQTARNFIHNHVASQQGLKPEIKVGKLDSRLKLKKCNKSLRAFLPKGSRELGKTTIGVKCAGSHPWSLHVPVTISLYKNVVVSSRTLRKGDVITAGDVKLSKHNIADLSYGYFVEKKSGVGMKVKRRAVAGTVLTPSMLKKPLVISRGQRVAIMAQSGRMEVRMMGKALNNGAIGDRIKVINIKSKQKLEAVVTSSSEVKVDI